jgi:hypothetical protein
LAACFILSDARSTAVQDTAIKIAHICMRTIDDELCSADSEEPKGKTLRRLALMGFANELRESDSK